MASPARYADSAKADHAHYSRARGTEDLEASLGMPRRSGRVRIHAVGNVLDFIPSQDLYHGAPRADAHLLHAKNAVGLKRPYAASQV
jgi:hypothetical protein